MKDDIDTLQQYVLRHLIVIINAHGGSAHGGIAGAQQRAVEVAVAAAYKPLVPPCINKTMHDHIGQIISFIGGQIIRTYGRRISGRGACSYRVESKVFRPVIAVFFPCLRRQPGSVSPVGPGAAAKGGGRRRRVRSPAGTATLPARPGASSARGEPPRRWPTTYRAIPRCSKCSAPAHPVRSRP